MLVGITGTLGAGKGAAVAYLISKKNYTHISARGIWTEELEARNITVNRDTMTSLANELRAEHGPAYFVERALNMVGQKDSVVIESIRTVAEAKLLREAGGVLLVIDANREERYRRISGRGSALDDVSYRDFVRQEDVEMENEDPNKQNIAKVIEMADYTILNEETLVELHNQIDVFLEKFA